MKKGFQKTVAVLLFAIASTSFAPAAYAQCAMCSQSAKAAADKGGNKAAAGINNGIYILLVLPYAIATVVGVVWYKNVRRKR